MFVLSALKMLQFFQVLCALKNPAIARSFVLCALKHAASFRVFVPVHFEVLQFQRFLKWTFRPRRAWQSSLAAAAGALGTAHSKRVPLLEAIWQRDRTQAQTDDEEGELGGRGRIGISNEINSK